MRDRAGEILGYKKPRKTERERETCLYGSKKIKTDHIKMYMVPFLFVLTTEKCLESSPKFCPALHWVWSLDSKLGESSLTFCAGV